MVNEFRQVLNYNRSHAISDFSLDSNAPITSKHCEFKRSTLADQVFPVLSIRKLVRFDWDFQSIASNINAVRFFDTETVGTKDCV
jgi:hypothetical protein